MTGTSSREGAAAVEPLNIEQVTCEYFPRIYRAALVLSGNPWDADDLAQETFLVLSAQNDQFQRRSSVYTWLYGILLNLDRRERRRTGMRRRKLKVLWENEPDPEKTAPAAETTLEVAEWKKSLWAWVDQLPDGQRHVLVLRFSEGLRYDEIAEVVGCPLGTVKSRIFHGLAALRRMLDGEDEIANQLREFPYKDLTHAI